MPLEERKDRWQANMAVLRANSVHDWASISCKRSPTKPKRGARQGAGRSLPSRIRRLGRLSATGAALRRLRLDSVAALFHDPWLGASTRAILHGRRTLQNCARSIGFPAHGDERHGASWSNDQT